MKSVTTQSGAIRTLTEDELGAVSGGFNLYALAYRFEHTPLSAYVPRKAPSWGWYNNGYALSAGPWI